MPWVRRLPIAVRLLSAALVPLAALVGLLTIEVADARAAGAAVEVELDRVDLLKVLSHLQVCVMHPEVIEYDMWPRAVDPDPLEAATIRGIHRSLTQQCRAVLAVAEGELRQHGDLLGPIGRAAITAEVDALRPFLADEVMAVGPSSPEVADLRSARDDADTALTDLMTTFDGDSWVAYRGSVDIMRAVLSEASALLATLAGRQTVDPGVLSALAGARRGAVNGIGFGMSEQIRRNLLVLVGGAEYQRYEMMAVRAREVADGWRRPDTATQFADAAMTTLALAEAIQRLEEFAETQSRRVVEAERDRVQARAQLALLLAVATLVVTLALAVAVVKSILVPLGDLTRRAKELGAGRLDGRPVDVRGRDELSRLGVALEDSAGTLRHVNEQAQAIADGRLDDPSLDRPAPGILGEVLHQNVQAVRSMASRLQHDADHDPLTGLLNRAALERHVRNLHDSPQRWLLYLDLDGFKPINDEYGHMQGDDVLRAVAQRLLRALRPGDLVARLGGDEFAAVLTLDSDTPQTELDATVRRLVDSVRAPVPKRRSDSVLPTAETVSVGVSIGRAHLPSQASLAAALATADAEMYVIKQAGRVAALALQEDPGPRRL